MVSNLENPILDAKSPDQMGALIRDTFRAMVDRVEHQFDGTELSLPQWLTLKLLNSGRISCIGDVNRELGMESGASTRLVDLLERKGWVVRKRGCVDRRVVRITLTNDGLQVIKAMQPRITSFWIEQLGVFSVSEAEHLFSLLTRLRSGLTDSSAK